LEYWKTGLGRESDARDSVIFGEKSASRLVVTGMKIKLKIGAGCDFKNIVNVARKALRKKFIKECVPKRRIRVV